MKEYLIMFLSLFRLAGKKIRHGKNLQAAPVQRISPGARFFMKKGPMPCWAITAASAAAEIFL